MNLLSGQFYKQPQGVVDRLLVWEGARYVVEPHDVTAVSVGLGVPTPEGLTEIF